MAGSGLSGPFVRGLLFPLFCLMAAGATVPEASAQDPPPDTVQRALQDTTGRAAAQQAGEPARGVVQDSIIGWGATIDVVGDLATFTGNPEKTAWVRYLGMRLDAGIIIFDSERNLLTALPLPDSLGSADGVVRHRPIFQEGTQRVVGDRMIYDLEAEKGTVFGADTAYERGYYHGSRISAIADETDYLLVRDGRFTTCDAAVPHYHFSSRRMKIIPEKRIIARPVVMYVRGIPILGLPFLVRSLTSGRQSGLLMPKIGSSTLTGSTIRDVGFYWAPNEYADSRLAFDLTSSQGVIVRGRTRYNLRYLLQGNVDLSYNYNRLLGRTQYDLRFNHRQDLSPSLSVVGQGNFSSTGFTQRLSEDPSRRLQRILRSHLNARKQFRSGASLSATVSQNNYLDRGVTDTQLPNLTFRVPRRPLFGSRSDRGSGSGSTQGGLRGFSFGPGSGPVTVPPAWYENLYLDYNNRLISNIQRTETPADPLTGAAAVDTTVSQAGIEQSANLTYSGKAFGWMNVQPSLSARESWYLGDTATDGFQRRLVWNSSMRTSTKLYGLADRPFGIDASFRHVVEPSLSLTYSPDFTTLPDVPTLFGGNPGPQMTLGFSLGQIFQMKRMVGEQERRTDLVRITSTASYNERARGQKLSDFNTSVVMNPSRALGLNLTARHSFYKPGTTNELQLTPTLLTIGSRSTLRFNSRELLNLFRRVRRAAPAAEEAEAAAGPSVGGIPPAAEEEEDLPFDVPTVKTGDLGGRQGRPRGAGADLFSVNLSHDFGWTRGSTQNQQSIDGSINFNLPKWNISWSARYDFERKELVSQTINIYRDLHCWQASLNLRPTGPGRGFVFVISIKEIPEIKYEQRRTIFP